MKKKIYVIFFVVLLGGLSLWNLFTPDRAFSEQESRYLASMPDFSWNSLVNGEYIDGIESYVTDQFAGRDQWVGVKTLSEKWMGKKDSGGVYFASDGSLIEMFDSVDRSLYQSNLEYIKEFEEECMARYQIQVQTMLVPTASDIYSGKLFPYTPELSQAELLLEAQQTLSGFVDVRGALAAHNGEYIYYRTDHHWTSLGAYYAYQSWRESEGISCRSIDDFEQQELSNSFLGSTYSKANLFTVRPDVMTAMFPKNLGALTVNYNLGQRVTDTIYETKYLNRRDKYPVYLDGNQPLVSISTGVSNGKRLMLIKDSYANTFVQMLLTDYEEIIMVDLRYMKAPLHPIIQEKNITDILIQYNLKGFSSDPNLYILGSA